MAELRAVHLGGPEPSGRSVLSRLAAAYARAARR